MAKREFTFSVRVSVLAIFLSLLAGCAGSQIQNCATQQYATERVAQFDGPITTPEIRGSSRSNIETGNG